MFKTSLGAEDYGPPAPTEEQKTGQAIIDAAKTGIDRTTVMYIAGGVIGAYFLWNWFFKGWVSDSSQY